MSRLFYHVMQDNAGNLLFDVSGTMRLAGSGTLATIYGDEALTVILPNPMTNHPSFGSFKCYLGASASGYDFYMAKSGYTFETLTGVQGLGTMAQQNASAVAITGGSAIGMGTVYSNTFVAPNSAGNNVAGFTGQIVSAGGVTRYNINLSGDAPSFIAGRLLLGSEGGPANNRQMIRYPKVGFSYGLGLQVIDNDFENGGPFVFVKVDGTAVGSVTTTNVATLYNTSSDARLKFAITPLTGALDVVRSLRPITHLWRSDDSPGVGFLADEVQQVIPAGVVTGEKDAVDADGVMSPQMIDMSKLVPYLTAALKEALERIDALTARLDAAGA